MSVKYSKLATEESDSTVIDFGSPFKYKNKEYPKYFSYSNNDNMYKSVFTYSGYRPEGYGDFGRYFVGTVKNTESKDSTNSIPLIFFIQHVVRCQGRNHFPYCDLLILFMIVLDGGEGSK